MRSSYRRLVKAALTIGCAFALAATSACGANTDDIEDSQSDDSDSASQTDADSDPSVSEVATGTYPHCSEYAALIEVLDRLEDALATENGSQDLSRAQEAYASILPNVMAETEEIASDSAQSAAHRESARAALVGYEAARDAAVVASRSLNYNLSSGSTEYREAFELAYEAAGSLVTEEIAGQQLLVSELTAALGSAEDRYSAAVDSLDRAVARYEEEMVLAENASEAAYAAALEEAEAQMELEAAAIRERADSLEVRAQEYHSAVSTLRAIADLASPSRRWAAGYPAVDEFIRFTNRAGLSDQAVSSTIFYNVVAATFAATALRLDAMAADAELSSDIRAAYEAWMEDWVEGWAYANTKAWSGYDLEDLFDRADVYFDIGYRESIKAARLAVSESVAAEEAYDAAESEEAEWGPESEARAAFEAAKLRIAAATVRGYEHPGTDGISWNALATQLDILESTAADGVMRADERRQRLLSQAENLRQQASSLISGTPTVDRPPVEEPDYMPVESAASAITDADGALSLAHTDLRDAQQALDAIVPDYDSALRAGWRAVAPVIGCGTP